MSATLFGRGVMTQVGARQRAEATERALASLRSEMSSLQYLQMMPTQIRALETRLQAAERKIASLETELEKVSTATVAATAATTTATPTA